MSSIRNPITDYYLSKSFPRSYVCVRVYMYMCRDPCLHVQEYSCISLCSP